MGADRQGRRLQGRRNPESGMSRPGLESHQREGGAEGCMPVALGHAVEVDAQVKSQISDVPDQARQ